MSKVELMELSLTPLTRVRKFTAAIVDVRKKESISFAQGKIEKICLSSSGTASM